MNIKNKKIFLKKKLIDKRNKNNTLFEIEIYDNNIFQFNFKYSYSYYNFKITDEKEYYKIIIFLKENNKIVNKYKVNKENLFLY